MQVLGLWKGGTRRAAGTLNAYRLKTHASSGTGDNSGAAKPLNTTKLCPFILVRPCPKFDIRCLLLHAMGGGGDCKLSQQSIYGHARLCTESVQMNFFLLRVTRKRGLK